uniref:Cilia- and flagella-associated protein 43 n=1 Tax=Seriola lalandi dorsalis TaxID=1841481 RepID=A0A3B4YYF0_SERLL
MFGFCVTPSRWVQGFTNKSIEFVDNKTVCYTSGSHICFLNLETKLQSVLQGPGGGIGALTANGTSGIFAFSEQRLSPSIFVYIFPQLQLKNELKGTAQLDYTTLTLSNGGPYLGCCSSLPDHTITVWNWENAEPICTQPQAGQDVISLVFNPQNWLHRLGSTSKQNVNPTPHVFTQTKLCTKARLTPTAICWTATSELYVGCAEGFLLLVDPESFFVSVLFNPTSKQTHTVGLKDLKDTYFYSFRPATTVIFSPDYETLLISSDTVSTQIYHSVACHTYKNT